MASRPARFSSVIIKPIRSNQNATGDLLSVQTGAGVVLARLGASASAFGLGLGLQMARAKYDFAVDGGGAPGLITPATNAIIPDNAIIIGGIANPTTALVGTSTTIAIGTSAGSAANSLKVATAEATYSIDAILPLSPVFTAGSAVKMTAAGSITITTAVAALSAGVMEITVWYYQAAA